MNLTLKEIAAIINGEIVGDENISINGPAKIEEALPGTITFLSNSKYESFIYDTQASAVLIHKDFKPERTLNAALIKVEDVYGSLGVLLEHFNNQDSKSGIASSAIIDPSVVYGSDTYVGDHTSIDTGVVIGDECKIYPQVTIGSGVKIGSQVTIMPGVRIYKDCIIGDRVIIHSNTVIGSDGFGFSKDREGRFKKIPQLGNVIIEDDVEIGSNVTIDRATIGSTKICKGAKLDNLIQIAHNVEIGENTAIAAQTGIAGSAKIGKNCLIGGQVGIAGHLKIADGTMVQAQSGIGSSNSPELNKLYGSPAIGYANYLKSYAHFKNLPRIVNDLRELKKQIANLEQNLK